MSNENFQKGTCALCGGNIEFPATAGGMTVECPHCGQQTELPPAQKPSRSMWGLLIFAVVGVAVAVGALFFLKSRQPKSVAAPSAVISSNPVPVAAESPRPKSAGDLKLVGNVSIEKAQGSRLSYAMGTLKNDSEHQRYGVKVEIDLFDQAGNKLPTQANDYLQSLEPGKEWKFRALVVDLKAVTAKLAAVKEED